MIDETFAQGTSVIHRLDPRVKLIAVSVFSVLVALANRFPVLFLALGLSIGLIFIAKLSAKAVLTRVKTVLLFLFLIWLVLPLTYDGLTYFAIGPFAVTRPGAALAARITVKSLSIVLATIALVTTMSLANNGQALRRLKVPSKLVLLLLMTYRYLFVIEQEYQRLIRAARIRGFKPQTRLHTYNTYAYIIGMLFVRASARAERVHRAMLCRGFRGSFYSLQDFTVSLHDRVFLVGILFFSVILIWFEWIKTG